MEIFRLKQIVFALCVMASLVTASAAACTCSHHEETKATETDCHSHHDSSEMTEAAGEANAVDESCVCYVNERSLYVTSKTESKDLRLSDAVAEAEQIVPDFELAAGLTLHIPSPKFVSDVSYSYILKSLLPPRAPPRP